MLNSSFEIRSFGKWILSGEHTVLRGGPALVFPLYEYYIDIRGQGGNEELKIEFKGSYASSIDMLFWGLLDKAVEKVGRHRAELKGHWIVDSQIPLGAGLGASAAMCVAVSKVFLHLGWIEKSEVYDFSRNLENMFHGESSGVDIAASLSETGLRFLKAGERTPFIPKWQPNWFISYSDQRGLTAECVKKVKTLGEKNPNLLKKWDQVMIEATEMAYEALHESETTGRKKLERSIDMGCSCFYEWGLVEGGLKKHIQELKSAGASAVKPTGSGGGGYVLSLWDQVPPDSLRDRLIPLKITDAVLR